MNRSTLEASYLLVVDTSASWDGVRALAEHLDYLKDAGASVSLETVIAAEYASENEAVADYPGVEDMNELKDITTVLPLQGGGVVVAEF